MPTQFIGMELSPLCGAEQHRFLSIPGAVNHGALRFPSLLQKLGKRAGFFEQSDLCRNGILRAVHPCIMVIAANDPSIRLSCARNFGDDVVHRLNVPIRSYLQMYFGWSNPNVIWQWKPAPPFARSHWTPQCLQQRLRICVRDREHRNLCDGLRIFAAQTFRIRRRSDSWSEWVAGIA